MDTAWEKIYRANEFLDRDPHPEFRAICDLFRKRNIKRVLDLGSGGGRHAILLAEEHFDIYCLDSSATGLAYSMIRFSAKGLSGHFSLFDIAYLPYDRDYFDGLISIQVIHHNRLNGVISTISEISRVVRPGGLLWVTMPVSKNEPSKTQEEIEPGTFVPLDGREKGLPHHYFKEDEIPRLFYEFAIIDLHIDPFNHYSFLGQRRPREQSI
ncbi:MAG: class I SAM-dependent methyltransferase [Patescibacteria group bacterium]|jgi:SAM-dependent methyltransferase